MIIQLVNKENLVIPFRGTVGSVGYDIVAATDPKIVGEQIDENLYASIDYIEYNTELQITPIPDRFYDPKSGERGEIHYYTEVHPRSSITKYNLILKNSAAIIDGDYSGNILLRFAYLIQPRDLVIRDTKDNGWILVSPDLNKIYKKGDRCGQLIVREAINASFAGVDFLTPTERGSGGFQSTGV